MAPVGSGDGVQVGSLPIVHKGVRFPDLVPRIMFILRLAVIANIYRTPVLSVKLLKKAVHRYDFD